MPGTGALPCHSAEPTLPPPPTPHAQVVSDYLTSFDNPQLMMQAGGKPVVVYTYSMAFRRPAAAAPAAGPGAAGQDEAAAAALEGVPM